MENGNDCMIQGFGFGVRVRGELLSILTLTLVNYRANSVVPILNLLDEIRPRDSSS